MKVALLGLGTVGAGVWQILTDRAGRDPLLEQVTVVGIAVRDLTKLRDPSVPPALLTTDAMVLVSDPEVEVVVEVLGGVESTLPLLKTALDQGKHVVSANKALLARHYRALTALARQREVYLLFEAAVGGGIPLIQPVRQCLGANRLRRLVGVINGTTNYILTAMTQSGVSYTQALKEAQAFGFAEQDPTADVAGHDAQEKLALLSALVFRTAIVDLADIPREGITGIVSEDLRYAKELGYGIKLLALAEKNAAGALYLRVSPHFVPQAHPLNRVQGADNAVLVEGEPIGQVMFSGPGAGSGPTASAVVSDILNIVARQTFQDPHFMGEPLCVPELLPALEHRGRFYVRLEVPDQPGVIGLVGHAFGTAAVSLESVVQKASQGTRAELVVITHWVKEGQLQQALQQLRQLGMEIGSVLRVLDEETPGHQFS
ncbi:homoserine dehydrogenase [Candidatus Cyanaurora vandensis]|uniref:homoserine dehydrogenase n=1 Tax=Candidatus Cyanaurora vandensis TaxID=2714958 RepID=UPI002580B1E5|nr:homoserine dehydrogenase [Candidatus Cyanaurora vandensis]